MKNLLLIVLVSFTSLYSQWNFASTEKMSLSVDKQCDLQIYATLKNQGNGFGFSFDAVSGVIYYPKLILSEEPEFQWSKGFKEKEYNPVPILSIKNDSLVKGQLAKNLPRGTLEANISVECNSNSELMWSEAKVACVSLGSISISDGKGKTKIIEGYEASERTASDELPKSKENLGVAREQALSKIIDLFSPCGFFPK